MRYVLKYIDKFMAKKAKTTLYAAPMNPKIGINQIQDKINIHAPVIRKIGTQFVISFI